MDFEAELKHLLVRAEVAGTHGLVIAQHLADQAHQYVAAELTVVRRHNPQLFPSDAKGG